MMDLRAILFDVNGTLIDIETDEGQDRIYRVISRFLTYQGVQLAPEAIRDRYFEIMEQQRQRSQEQFAEFDAVAIGKPCCRRKARRPAGRKRSQRNCHYFWRNCIGRCRTSASSSTQACVRSWA